MKMENLSKFFAAVSVLFGTIPGVGILTSSLVIPPQTSKPLFAAVIEITGILTLLLLWLNKESIKSRSVVAISKAAIIGGCVFILSLSTYLFMFNSQIIEVPDSEALFFPFFPQGELAEGLNEFGSKYNLIQEWGRDDVFKVILSSSQNQLNFSILVFLFFYQLIFVSLTFSFGILGIKIN